MFRSFLCSLAGFCLLSVLVSCANTKAVVYFNNIGDSTIQVQVENLEPVIHKNDILNIIVTSANPELTQVFNATSQNSSSSQATGYLVNQDGTIDFPLLGSINAVGMTKKKLKETITKGLIDKKLLLDPIVDVRYLNFRVSILGEVGHPSVITAPSEKLSILEAISLAGDLTLSAKRDNIMLIREEEGTKTIKRLNMNSSDLFKSPYYYLKSGDILYVEPNRTKIAGNSRFNQIFPIVISSISIAFLVIDRIFR